MVLAHTPNYLELKPFDAYLFFDISHSFLEHFGFIFYLKSHGIYFVEQGRIQCKRD